MVLMRVRKLASCAKHATLTLTQGGFAKQSTERCSVRIELEISVLRVSPGKRHVEDMLYV